MLPAQQEGSLLRDVVRTMMAQICKVGVTYSSDLLIEGTVVVTVDKQKVIVIHFDDRLPTQFATSTQAGASDSSTVASSDVNCVAEGVRTAISELTSRHFTAAGVTNRSGNPGWFVGSTSTKMMTCLSELSETLNERVAIDVDSEDDAQPLPFNDIDLADCSSSVQSVPVVVDQVFPNVNKSRRTCRKVKDAKNVIIIEDSELLEPACDVSEPVDDYSNSELKLLDSFTSRYLLPSTDCESVGDAYDTRSLTSNSKQGVESTALCCEMCGWQGRNKSQIESHLVSRHGIVDSRRLGRRIAHISCSLCGKRFRFRAQFDKHRLTHCSGPAERLHRCLECRNAYSQAQSLALHSQVHDKNATLGGVDRLSCMICNKSYATKVLFQKHIMYMHERTGCADN